MVLRRSAYIHLIRLDDALTLVLHAVSQLRVTVTPEVARVIEWFDQPQALEPALPRMAAALGHDAAVLRACALLLLQRGILSERDAAAELEDARQDLAPVHGRDPEALLDRLRRATMEGAHPAWTVAAPLRLAAPTGPRRRLDVLLFGDCDLHMEADFLRREAERRGVDLRVAAAFAGDADLAGERRHDAIVVGALQARHAIVLGEPRHHDGDPSLVYVAAARGLLGQLRALSAAPILLDGLPEPTLQPLGMADRGAHSHLNRFRRTNLALAELADQIPDTYLVDVAAALAAAGSERLLDDGLTSFTHFGAPGWMLQRPAEERAAVGEQFPDMATLAQAVGGDPYQREAVMARAHMDTLAAVLGLGRKKCVIVDLDGVLWPGVLAETGQPFRWTPEISGPHSYIGLYFGIHEALLALRQRGILLACVSKNDEAVVRALWRYPSHHPLHRLLTPDSFVAARINWQDKAENIRSIAEELGFALDAFVFIDDTARERERVRESLPQVAVLGEDLFALRRRLLTDPGLQPPRLTAESARRSELTEAQAARSRLRGSLPDPAAFIAALQIVTEVDRLTPDCDPAVLARVQELFDRTTQFNATGVRFTAAELRRLLASPDGRVVTLRVRDRLGDHGLVGAAVVAGGEIRNVALSCRVIGLGVERTLLAALAAEGGALRGRIVATERNAPARHLYRDCGFRDLGGGEWVLASAADQATASAADASAA